MQKTILIRTQCEAATLAFTVPYKIINTATS